MLLWLSFKVLVLLPLTLALIFMTLILGRFALMVCRFHWTKSKYSHLIHCHPKNKKPSLLRMFSPYGEALEMAQEAFDPARQQYHDVTYQGLYFGGLHMVGISNPDDIKIMFNQPDAFLRPALFEKLKDLLGTGLVTSEGEDWRRQRKILTPAFHFTFLKGLYPSMAKNTRALLTSLAAKNGTAFHPFEEFREALLQVILDASISDDCLDKKRVIQSFNGIVQHTPTFFASRFIFGTLDSYIPFDFASKCVREKRVLNGIVSEGLQKKRQQMEAAARIKAEEDNEAEKNQAEEGRRRRTEDESESLNKKQKYSVENGKDFITLMTESGLDDQTIIDNIVTFLFAGHDSSSNLLCWALYYLCKYPEYQDKLHQQLTEGGFNLGENEEDESATTLDQLEQFPLLRQIIKEAGRLRPLGVANGRQLAKDTVMADGTWLPKDTVVNIMICQVHQDPRFWERPQEFWPERFSQKGEEGEMRHPYAYIPFSAGPRSCIGQKLFMQEAQLVLAGIVSKFELTANVEEVIVDTSFVISAKGLKVKFIPRDH